MRRFRCRPFDVGRVVGILVAACWGLACADAGFAPIAVETDEGYGFVSYDGTVVVEPTYAYVFAFSNGLAAVADENWAWGYIGPSGDVAIAPQFASASSFHHGYAPAALDDEDGRNVWGYIDREGLFVRPPQYRVASLVSEGIAVVRRAVDGEGGVESLFIDPGTGEVLAGPFLQAHQFSEGLAAVMVEDKWGFIDSSGEIVVPAKFDAVGSYKEGLAAVRIEGRVGYVDERGQVVIEPRFVAAGEFRDGLAPVRTTDWVFGFVYDDGEFAIDPQFDAVGPYSEGRAPVLIAGNWGFVDGDGGLAVNPQFSEVSRFHSGTTVVRRGDRYGFIDRHGSFVIEPSFSDVIEWQRWPKPSQWQWLVGAGPIREGLEFRQLSDVTRLERVAPDPEELVVRAEATCREVSTSSARGVVPLSSSFEAPCTVSYVLLPGRNEIDMQFRPEDVGSFQHVAIQRLRPLETLRLTGEVAGLRIDPDDPIRRVVLEVSEEARLRVAVSGHDGFDPLLRIRGSSGNQLAADDDSGPGRDALMRGRFTSGTYVLEASAANRRNPEGTVTVTVAE